MPRNVSGKPQGRRNRRSSQSGDLRPFPRRQQQRRRDDPPLHRIGDIIIDRYEVLAYLRHGNDSSLLRCVDLMDGLEYKIEYISHSMTNPPWMYDIYTSQRARLISQCQQHSDFIDSFEVINTNDRRFYLVMDYFKSDRLPGPEGCRSTVVVKGDRSAEIDIPAARRYTDDTPTSTWRDLFFKIFGIILIWVIAATYIETDWTSTLSIFFLGSLFMVGLPSGPKKSYAHVHIKITPNEWRVIEFAHSIAKPRDMKECVACYEQQKNSSWSSRAYDYGGRTCNLLQAEISVNNNAVEEDVMSAQLILNESLRTLSYGYRCREEIRWIFHMSEFRPLSLGYMHREEARWIAHSINKILDNIWQPAHPHTSRRSE